MYVCELIPLKTTKKLEFLSYYTTLNINIGDLVSINMNNQKLDAIVFSINSLREKKIYIKSEDFKLKKITKVTKEKFIDSKLVPALYNISTLLGTSLNNIFNTLVRIDTLDKIDFKKRKKTKSEIRFIEDINYITNNNQKNKLSNSYFIVPTKVLAKRYSKIYGEEFVSTPSFNFLIDDDIDTVYVLEENSKYYFQHFKDLDTKKAIIEICKALNIDVILVAGYPNVSTFKMLRDQGLTLNLKDEHKVNIIKMNDPAPDGAGLKDKNIYIHDSLTKELKEAVKQNKRIIIYNLRKSYATSSICNDCNNYIKCSTCDKILSINEEGGIRYYVCSKCKTKTLIDKLVLCPVCTSYNINVMGIGTSGIQEYLKNNLQINSSIIDSDNPAPDSAGRAKTIKKIINNWNENGGVIIGTELLINNLQDECTDLIIITSVDSLFMINNYLVDEYLFMLFNKLKSLLTPDGSIYLETRREIKELSKYSVKNFYDSELKSRKSAMLPPYYYIITFNFKERALDPEFLKPFKKVIYKFKKEYKYIYFIESDMWESDARLRSISYESLKNLNYKVNPIKILE